jgi:hypothetical protein
MNVRVLGIPMIDGDPVEISTQIALGFGHQVACECFDIGEFGRVVGRDDEPEMMPVALASLSEGLMIDIVAPAPNIRACSPSLVTPSRRR